MVNSQELLKYSVRLYGKRDILEKVRIGGNYYDKNKITYRISKFGVNNLWRGYFDNATW